MCKGIETTECLDGRLDNPAVVSAAKEIFESLSCGSKVETKPKPIVSPVPRNKGSNLIGVAVHRGSAVVGERWRRGII